MSMDFLKAMGRAVVCAFFLVTACWSDSLTLRDGRHLEGKYVGGSSEVIAFVTNGAVQYFPVTDVLAVVFGNPGVDRNGIQQNSFRNQRAHAHHLRRAHLGSSLTDLATASRTP